MPSTFYDSLALNEDIELDLSMLEATGTITHDESKNHIMATAPNGLIWDALAAGNYGISLHELFSRYLDAPAADTTALNFTSGDYSLAVWINPGFYAEDSMIIMGRYAVNIRGWELYYYDPTNLITLRHHHAGGATTRTACYSGGWLRDGEWRLFGATRIGGVAQHYMNGQPITTTGPAGGLLDPATDVADDLVIGVRHTKDNNFWTGHLHRPRAWSRALTALEHYAIYEAEKGWFS
jgi:hypothetical protein